MHIKGQKGLSQHRIGSFGLNKFGSKMKVMKYSTYSDVWIQFEDGNLVHTTWHHFCKGKVKNPYDKSVYGIGYLGEGNYKAKENGKMTIQYECWHRMLERCYSEKFQEKYPTYKNCSVTPIWHNFQNFAKWHDENYYEIEGERMDLDKDILVKGNKIYSPEKCVFVTRQINNLFVKNNATRGDCPIGVSTDNRDGKYVAKCMIGNGNNSKSLGYHNDEYSAFLSYKTFKEKHIRDIAEEYKERIPVRLYQTMMNYIVEIND